MILLSLKIIKLFYAWTSNDFLEYSIEKYISTQFKEVI